MKFTMQRDRVVVSLTGRSVRFEKGVPIHVPPEMHDEVLALGAEADEALPEKKAPKEPAKGSPEREADVFAAFELIVERNRNGDFTAGNTPHAGVVSTEAGFKVDAAERDALWHKFSHPEEA